MLSKWMVKAVGTGAVASVLLASVAGSPLLASDGQAAAIDEWTQLGAGASHTIEVHYDAIEENGDIVSETVVELEMGSTNSVAFDVYTADQYVEFVAGEDVKPIGRGNLKSDQTGNSFHNTKLLWANRTVSSETFHIRIKNRGAGSSSYRIHINGKGTSVKGMDAVAAAAPAAESASVARSAVAADVKAAPAEALIADGPDTAIGAAMNAGTLAAGETRWYTFKYDYDHSSDKPAKDATVAVKMNEKDSVSFEVWTSEQVRQWALGEDISAVGAGSVFKDVDTTLIWVGSAAASDRYYVLVENETDSPAGFNIEISGSTVSY